MGGEVIKGMGENEKGMEREEMDTEARVEREG